MGECSRAISSLSISIVRSRYSERSCRVQLAFAAAPPRLRLGLRHLGQIPAARVLRNQSIERLGPNNPPECEFFEAENLEHVVHDEGVERLAAVKCGRWIRHLYRPASSLAFLIPARYPPFSFAALACAFCFGFSCRMAAIQPRSRKRLDSVA